MITPTALSFVSTMAMAVMMGTNTNMHGGGVDALRAGRSVVEDSALAAKVSAASEYTDEQFWNLASNLQSAEDIWADISTLSPIYDDHNDMVAKENMLDDWYNLGTIMYFESSNIRTPNETVTAQLKGFSKLLMTTTDIDNRIQHAPDHSSVMGMLATVNYATEQYAQISAGAIESVGDSSDNGGARRATIFNIVLFTDIESAKDDVQEFILDLLLGYETPSAIWSLLQGSNGYFDEWFDLSMAMIAEAPFGAQPLKLAKCGRVAGSVCTGNIGQPLPIMNDLITILSILNQAFHNFLIWYI